MFSIVGFSGRCSALRSARAGHSKRWCSTVSSGHGQSGQELSCVTPILLKCEFSGTCCVRRRKIVTDSFLIYTVFGFLGSHVLEHILRVSPLAHSFIHSSFFLLLIIISYLGISNTIFQKNVYFSFDVNNGQH